MRNDPPPPAVKFTAVLVGDDRPLSFAQVANDLRQNCQLMQFPSLEDLLQQRPDELPSDLFLLQDRPGQIDQQLVQRVRAEYPLVRIVAVVGSWCEGELRSGIPWQPDARVFWHQWPQWWPHERRQLLQKQATSWQKSRVDTPLRQWQPSTSWEPFGQGELIALATRDRSFARTLQQFCERIGLRTYWQPRGRYAPLTSPPEAGIWDGAQGDSEELEALRQFADSVDAVPIIALADFPRRDRYASYAQNGAEFVLAKPFQATDLADLLRQALASRCPREEKTPDR